VYLPAGTWAHYWTGQPVTGPAHVLAHAPLGQPALYVRANTPLPLWPAMVFDGERAPDPLTWLVHLGPGAAGRGELYEDAGDGYAHEAGEFARTVVRCATGESIVLDFEPRAGTFRPPRAGVELDVRGLERPSRVRVDGQDISDWQHDGQRLLLRLPVTAEARRIEITAALVT
jgi:alpha-glucosidase